MPKNPANMKCGLNIIKYIFSKYFIIKIYFSKIFYNEGIN